MRLSVASGKGGTGKTTIAVSLYLAAGPECQLIDCDVEEPNANIFLKKKINKVKKVFSPLPRIDAALCDLCGMCAEVCEFNALLVTKEKVLVFPELCHGCGACSILCPKKAITEEQKEIGTVQIGENFAQGLLNIGEAMAVPVIKSAKMEMALEKDIIIDCPPGTSCPVIESLKGSDYSVLVTEPTPFGLNDLKLMVEVVRIMNIPFGVIINQCDIGDNKTKEYCKTESITILLEIPWERAIAEGYSRGTPLLEINPEYRAKFNALIKDIKSRRIQK